MTNDDMNTEPAENPCSTLDDVAALYDLNPWTVRMWVNRFGDILEHSVVRGGMLFPPRTVERIGTISRMAGKKRLTIGGVRRLLEADNSDNPAKGGCEERTNTRRY